MSARQSQLFLQNCKDHRTDHRMDQIAGNKGYFLNLKRVSPPPLPPNAKGYSSHCLPMTGFACHIALHYILLTNSKVFAPPPSSKFLDPPLGPKTTLWHYPGWCGYSSLDSSSSQKRMYIHVQYAGATYCLRFFIQPSFPYSAWKLHQVEVWAKKTTTRLAVTCIIQTIYPNS